ncbi:hypothetical protein F8388_010579 [Cannabis sativa]|uniref:F-box protein n=1 Tax=Cannabis sativa TaxID=3483 RepID=A0A7J6GQ88_CANSA|nr:hypothetical protein G4B88_012530 [Cannabis sativa]KAF4384981.1 hypothetical protein F8388_010579 [Cannabis sativa]
MSPRMESLPDALVHTILLSYMNNARDVAICNCVSKCWKDVMPYISRLYFPRNCFDNLSGSDSPDEIVLRMVSSIERLEELVVYSPFSGAGLSSWLSVMGSSLRQLELRMDNLTEQQGCLESPFKLDCISFAKNLESLKLWGVRSVSIDLQYLELCKLDFYGFGNCSFSMNSPKIEVLEVQGCSWIRVRGTEYLKNLSIANNAGRVYMVDFGKLVALEFLSIRGVQWCWDAICNMLQWASEVKHLFMKVEFTGDFEVLQPFPEFDFVEFFNNHPKLQKFDIHGAMFAALCQKNSLKRINRGFVIPCLEEVAITIRSPLNAEQKMSTLESFLKFGKYLKTMTIKILQMKSNHSSADDFFDEICRFRYMNRKIVRIE